VQTSLLASGAYPPFDAGSVLEHPADREGDPTVNKVFLTGRLTRDPEMRNLASGKNVTTFTVASNEFLSGGREKAEYSNVVTWVSRPLGRTTGAVSAPIELGGRALRASE